MNNSGKRHWLLDKLLTVSLIFAVALSVSISFSSQLPARADTWAGWDAISTIYYNPAQEDTHNPFLHTAAQELRTYLQQMSGRSWTVVTGSSPAPPAIYLNVNPAQLSFYGDEAFRLVVDANGITITGKTAIAVRWGAYYLLDEKLGVRWFFKSPSWTIVPANLSNLSDTIEIHEPDFFWRAIECLNSMIVNPSELSDWYMHNKMLGAAWYASGHGSDAIVAHQFGTLSQSEFEDNIAAFLPSGKTWGNTPWNPAVGGDRQLNPTNLSVKQWSIDYVNSQLDVLLSGGSRYPDDLYLKGASLSPNDGQGWWPPYEQAEDPFMHDSTLLTNDYFAMLSAVADSISTGHPDYFVGSYSYADISDLITEVMSPNAIVVVAQTFSYSDNINSERFIAAKSSGATVGIYQYLNVWPWWGGEMSFPSFLDKVRQIKWLRDNGVTYYNAEALDSWGDRGLIYYLVGKMLWDADSDLDALLDDFFTKSFGEAANIIKEYYQTLDSSRAITMKQAYSLLSQANSLVGGNELTRVRDLEYYTRFLWKYRYVGVANLSNDDLADFYTFNCKVRDTEMLEYSEVENALHSVLLGRGYTEEQITALQDYTLPSANEAETWLAEGLAEFGIATGSSIVNARFLNLAALGDFTTPANPLVGGSRIILIKSNGSENITVNVNSLSWNGLAMLWYNPNGMAIDWWHQTGEFSTSVIFPAPEAGIYMLHITAGIPVNSYWVSVDIPNHPAALLCDRNISVYTEWESPLNPEFTGSNTQYFFVPVGTDSFTFGSTVLGTSASGTLYSPSNSPTAFSWTPTEYADDNSKVIISDPQPGLWKVSITNAGISTHDRVWLEGIPALMWHDPNYLLVSTTLPAGPLHPDVNGDSLVNVLDVISIVQHWSEIGTNGWIPQDINRDGAVNGLDIILIGQNWTG